MSTFHTHTGNIAQHQHPQWPPLFIPYNGLSSLQAYTFKKRDIFWGSIIYIKQRTPPAGSGSLLSSFYPYFHFFLGLIIRLSAFFLFFQILWREMKVCVIKWQNLIKWLSNRMAPHPMTIVNITTRLLFEIPFPHQHVNNQMC